MPTLSTAHDLIFLMHAMSPAQATLSINQSLCDDFVPHDENWGLLFWPEKTQIQIDLLRSASLSHSLLSVWFSPFLATLWTVPIAIPHWTSKCFQPGRCDHGVRATWIAREAAGILWVGDEQAIKFECLLLAHRYESKFEKSCDNCLGPTLFIQDTGMLRVLSKWIIIRI